MSIHCSHPFWSSSHPTFGPWEPLQFGSLVFDTAPLDCAPMFFSLRGCLRLKIHLFFHPVYFKGDSQKWDAVFFRYHQFLTVTNRNSITLLFTASHLLYSIFYLAQRLKCLPGMRETRVRSLGQEDPLEKEMAAHSSTLAWRVPWTEEPGRLQSMGLQRIGHWATSLHFIPNLL